MVAGCDVPNAEIKGTITYEKVPHSDISNGLEYTKSFEAPARGVLVELIENDKVIDSVITDDTGEYKFLKKMDTYVQIRVKAQLSNPADDEDDHSWQVQVVDNTNENALYTMVTDTFKVNNETLSKNLHAPSGWVEGKGYDNTRTAAPFHILDKVYDIIVKLKTVGIVELQPLTINWSPNNIPQFGDIESGQIGTSYYQEGQIFLLGAENVDTDEYDQHVIIHEWGHFFEDSLARSDSIGGAHAGGDYLDLRVAFGEGFGNAWSAMITDQPLYKDSFDQAQANGFSIAIEDNNVINPGWFSEGSVQSLLYDIYDEASDGQDFIQLGLQPIIEVLQGQQKETPALTSIFSFMTYLNQQYPAYTNDFSQLLEAQSITSDIDIWGSNASNNGTLAEALPVYIIMNPGDVKRVCTSTTQGADWNKLANHRFLKLNAPSAGSYTLTLTPSRNNDIDGYILNNGEEIAKDEAPGIDPVVMTIELPKGVSIADTVAYDEAGTSVVATCFDAELVMN
ncbi:Putative lipoprotein [Kangiella sediminilitoris]|uniref:Putative lipoprotein n=2 Tax=Kangiella sediminilitoris TaxID=1144748 RepID=A0A1B3B8A9_9GAMM|nr:Putative lipoprotein [Kangiella sediminilitoris]